MKEKILEFFQEDNGGMSMTRLMVFFVIVIPFIAWLVVCIYHWALQEMPTGVLTLQGAAFTTKLVQKCLESKSPAN
jgi:uncharacterized membrane protein (DUF106 family)